MRKIGLLLLNFEPSFLSSTISGPAKVARTVSMLSHSKVAQIKCGGFDPSGLLLNFVTCQPFNPYLVSRLSPPEAYVCSRSSFHRKRCWAHLDTGRG
ncbi:uncharacterized protein BDW43DRAFT_273284 [Aspergillus alliaceus]|uniref:uncharacterized protein n=1 Tax=Petromyces alliaceus TaxID=209559 RepID=UPI0012A3CFBE|nr:uncharacterized protein BDW43DRAFT_273284 [Aspergillus alliaceus]KAB8234486.1 hypothetical protein BDW43DRAFT_273284 [Aspergillus alliaceus]